MELDEAQENLRLIRLMMEEGRRKAGDNGIQWVLWGSFGALIFSLGLLLPSLHWEKAFPFAVGFLYLGAVALSVILAKRISRGRQSTFIDRAYAALWTGVIISIALIMAALFLTKALPFPAAASMISLVFGAGVFTSARLTGISWLIAVAILWWLGACALFLVPFMAASFLFLCLSLALCVAPGLILFAKRKK